MLSPMGRLGRVASRWRSAGTKAMRASSTRAASSRSGPTRGRRATHRGSLRRPPGSRRRPAPVSRTRSAAAPSGGTTARIRVGPPRVLVDLPRQHATSAARRPPERGGAAPPSRAAAASDSARGRYSTQLEAVSEAERLGPLAIGRRKSPTNRATASRSASRNACRNGRGSRLPKKLPVCVIRKRAPAVYSSPAKSSKSQPFPITHLAARLEAAHLGCDRLGHARDRVRLPGDEARDLLVRGLPRPRGGRVVAPMLIRDERIPKIRDPARVGEPLDRRPYEVHGAGRRGREDDVDPLLAHDPHSSRDRGHVPRHARVGQEQAPRGHLRLDERALEAVGGTQLLGGLACSRAQVARAMDPRLRRRPQLRVPMHPLRVVGRQHVRLDAERREVLGELERALHASTARRREVHRHEQDLHRREG